jgi:N-acetylglucosamine kinase
MILAFDIGGSRIRAATWDGQTLAPLGEVPTPTQDRAAFVQAIQGLAKGQSAQGLAISIAGVVDPDSGIGKVANIPAIDGLALTPLLTKATGLPVLVLNDADCFSLAEATLGAGRGQDTVFGIILGTGVGGGLVTHGRVLQGPGGFAGEWGHGPILRGPYAYACGCGQTGCLDTIGGARGLERLHLDLHAKTQTAPEIIHEWASGAAMAAATVTLWRDLLSGPLAMVVNLVGAGIVPVGGGLGRVPDLVRTLDQAVRKQILRPAAKPLVVPAHCGVDAGLLGAALAGQSIWG